mmetsp:Transcript_30345/g.90407  ORF Transcript_30345/g.90407 Transcript_30345/m.90407 type:complete len:241 (-) Transcript_30345:4436-5158(-)
MKPGVAALNASSFGICSMATTMSNGSIAYSQSALSELKKKAETSEEHSPDRAERQPSSLPFVWLPFISKRGLTPVCDEKGRSRTNEKVCSSNRTLVAIPVPFFLNCSSDAKDFLPYPCSCFVKGILDLEPPSSLLPERVSFTGADFILFVMMRITEPTVDMSEGVTHDFKVSQSMDNSCEITMPWFTVLYTTRISAAVGPIDGGASDIETGSKVVPMVVDKFSALICSVFEPLESAFSTD